MVKPDLIKQFMDLLHQIKDPRYVDFLCSVCTADGEPVAALQQVSPHNTALLYLPHLPSDQQV